jgi:hypothetical protein
MRVRFFCHLLIPRNSVVWDAGDLRWMRPAWATKTNCDKSVWALILLPVVLAIIQRRAIEPEEAFREKRFWFELYRL